MRAALKAGRAALRRTAAARNRLLAKQARHDERAWQLKRRERTRHLIELGGLVTKAGLVELTDDDRAIILGALLDAAARLRGDDADTVKPLWLRRGKRAFGQDNDECATD